METNKGKVFDLETKGWVDKPGAAAAATETATETETAVEEAATTETQTETETTTEEKKETEKAVAAGTETPEDVKKEETEVKKEEPEVKFEPNTWVKDKWGEKYGIENEDELNEVLSAQEELIDKYKELEAKAAEPKWRSEQEKKVAEFLQGYDSSRFGEGLNTIAAIMGMDPENISERQAYREAYILDHPHLTREEAGELADDDFEKKYSLNRDDFDDDATYEKRKRILEIQKKDEVTKARKTLAAKKDALKTPVEDKKSEEKAETKPEPKYSQETLQDYNNQIDKFFNPSKDKAFDRFQFFDDDNKTVLFNLVLDKPKLDSIKAFAKKYVESEQLYDKNGKIPKFDPQEVAKTALRVLHGDWMEAELWKQVKVLARTLKAEQIAGTSPEKKSGGKGDALLSPMDQFKKQADQAKAKQVR